MVPISVFFPEATPVLGNIKVKAVLTIADVNAPKVATELNATSSVDLSCFVRPFSPGITTGSGTAPNRLCTTTTLPQEGRTEFASFELSYIYDPQNADTDPDNAAKKLLVRGTVLYLVVRKGLDSRSSAFASGQRVETWKVRLGRQNKVTSGDDDQAEFQITQMAFPVLEVADEGILAA